MCVNIKHRFVNGRVFSLLQLLMSIHFLQLSFSFWSEEKFAKNSQMQINYKHDFALLTSCNKLQVVKEWNNS